MDFSKFKNSDTFIKNIYIQAVGDILPFLTVDDVFKLKRVIDERYKPSEVKVYNSYTCQDKILNAKDFLQDIYTKPLVMIENGTFFQDVEDHNDLPPSVEVEEYYGYDRDEKKALMKYYSKADKGNDPVKASYYDSTQLTDKLNMNTWYGLLQPPKSPHYNPHLASSITCRGRSMISVCALSAESVLAGYFPTKLEALLYTIHMVSNETTFNDIIMRYNYTVQDVLDNMGITPEYYGYEVLVKVLNKKDKFTINKLAIKNNIDRFLAIPEVECVIERILTRLTEINKPFVDPYNEPDKDGIKVCNDADLKELRALVPLVYGFYWYQGDFDRNFEDTVNIQGTIKALDRKVIALIDTDSNMIAMSRIRKKIEDKFGGIIANTFNPKGRRFTYINVATVIVDKVIDYSLDIYKEAVQIPDKYRFRVAMKNEYYYSSFSLSSRKKNYAGMCEIKEGVVFPKPKLDVKGLMFTKSTVNGNLGSDIEDLIDTRVMQVDKINLKNILKDLRCIADNMDEKLKSPEGHELYVSEKLNKKLIDVLDILSRTKSVETYNILNIGDKIVPPSRFLTAKVNFSGDDIKHKYPEQHKRLSLYGKVHTLHKAIKRVCDFNEGEFINKYAGVKIQNCGIVADKVNDLLKKQLWKELLSTDNNYSLFLNGYKKEDRNDLLSRDEMFTRILSYNDGDLDKSFDYMCSLIDTLRDKFKEYNKLINEITSPTKIVLLKIDETCIEDLNRMSIPESMTEGLPEFVLDVIDTTPDVIMVDNLAAPVVEKTKLVSLRNHTQKFNITNILNYF